MCASKPPQKTSLHSLAEANRNRVKFSGHGRALGAAGYREAANNPDNCEFLNDPGSSIAVSPGPNGFEQIMIGVAWNNFKIPDESLIGKMFHKTKKVDVDLDLGCLYELQDGTRGALQAFGKKYGAYEVPPFVALSGDERTGSKKGLDEAIFVNGLHWEAIKRLVVYIYIYEGAPRWSIIQPQIILDVPGENDLVVTLGAHNDALALCAVGGVENVRNGIKLTNFTEYFPGHEEMDRAFGFGLDWADGEKPPA